MLVENGFEIEVFRGRALGDIWWAKALLVLVSPILCCLGWDICRTQMLFRVRKGRVLGQQVNTAIAVLTDRVQRKKGGHLQERGEDGRISDMAAHP